MIKQLKYIKREENDVEKVEFSSMEELKNLISKKQQGYAFVAFSKQHFPVFLNTSGNNLYESYPHYGGVTQTLVDEERFNELKSRKILMIKPD